MHFIVWLVTYPLDKVTHLYLAFEQLRPGIRGVASLAVLEKDNGDVLALGSRSL